jgi:hypothetical protein
VVGKVEVVTVDREPELFVTVGFQSTARITNSRTMARSGSHTLRRVIQSITGKAGRGEGTHGRDLGGVAPGWRCATATLSAQASQMMRTNTMSANGTPIKSSSGGAVLPDP